MPPFRFPLTTVPALGFLRFLKDIRFPSLNAALVSSARIGVPEPKIRLSRTLFIHRSLAHLTSPARLNPFGLRLFTTVLLILYCLLALVLNTPLVTDVGIIYGPCKIIPIARPPSEHPGALFEAFLRMFPVPK